MDQQLHDKAVEVVQGDKEFRSFSAYAETAIREKLEVDGHLPATTDEERLIEKVRCLYRDGVSVENIEGKLAEAAVASVS